MTPATQSTLPIETIEIIYFLQPGQNSMLSSVTYGH